MRVGVLFAAGFAAISIFVGLGAAEATAPQGTDKPELDCGTTFLSTDPDDPCEPEVDCGTTFLSTDPDDPCEPEVDCGTTFLSGGRDCPPALPVSLPRDEPLSDEDRRIFAVGEMVLALESYANANGTYLVDGGGAAGVGSGWAFYELKGTSYPTSIASVLADEGHLPDDELHDPLWDSTTSIKGDVLVYRCKDRVAVFTRHGDSEPSASDSAWWTDNGCNRYPIDRLNATYFVVSEALAE